MESTLMLPIITDDINWSNRKIRLANQKKTGMQHIKYSNEKLKRQLEYKGKDEIKYLAGKDQITKN